MAIASTDNPLETNAGRPLIQRLGIARFYGAFKYSRGKVIASFSMALRSLAQIAMTRQEDRLTLMLTAYL